MLSDKEVFPVSLLRLSLLHLCLSLQNAEAGLVLFDSHHHNPLLERRELLQGGPESIVAGLYSSMMINSNEDNDEYTSFDKSMDVFQANKILWADSTMGISPSSSSDSWSRLRYGTSSLGEKNKLPNASNSSSSSMTHFPYWIEGSWLCTYKFDKAVFPLGRDKLTLRVPGAGLGTCLALPNIGYSPAPFVQKILPGGYEDVAFNLPRKFEAFWPQAKVTSIQTSIDENDKRIMSPACLVTGEGCTNAQNPKLHSSSATRSSLQFEGPTRRKSQKVSQTIDLSLVASTEQETRKNNSSYFVVSRSYVQYNIQQELQLFFKEFVSLTTETTKSMKTTAKLSVDNDNNRIIKGRSRVAAFLPQVDNETGKEYDDTQAIALYDYTMEWKEISSSELI